jgi:hypothetical protein
MSSRGFHAVDEHPQLRPRLPFFVVTTLSAEIVDEGQLISNASLCLSHAVFDFGKEAIFGIRHFSPYRRAGRALDEGAANKVKVMLMAARRASSSAQRIWRVDRSWRVRAAVLRDQPTP